LIPAFLNLACRAVFLALRAMHLTFIAALVEATIVLAASLYALWSGYGAIALMIILVIAKVMSASIALALLFRVLPVRPSLNLGFLLLTARTVFTFGIGNLLGMLTMRINVIMVSVWTDIASVGHFAAATKIMEIALMFPNLFPQLLMTRMAHSFAQGNRDPNRFGAWYRVLFALVVPTCVGGWVFAGLILEALFGPGFENAAWVVRILMIYVVIEAIDTVMSAILKAAQMQREDVSRLAFNPLTNIVLTLVLLPTLGMIGAAIGRVGGGAASAALRYFLISRELTAVNWLRFALKPTLISVGMGSVCYLWLDIAHPAWLPVFYVAVTVVLLRISAGFSPAVIEDMMSFRSTQD